MSLLTLVLRSLLLNRTETLATQATNFAENEPVSLPGSKLLLVGKRLSRIWNENANRGPARRVVLLSLLGN